MRHISIEYYKNPPKALWPKLIQRPSADVKEMSEVVNGIFKEVAQSGDEGLRNLTKRFDQVEIDNILVGKDEIEKGVRKIPQSLKSAIQKAYDNIYLFHKSQELKPEKIGTSKGITCWRESRPIEKVGLYIPGGSAPLFSTVLMLAIPAQIAGCEEVILCSPPDKNGDIHPAILFTAHLCGIDRIAKIGGAQAIAALTYGTDSFDKVDKIFGPGNQYVTAAKMKAVELGVSIDLPAGPSEVLVYADGHNKTSVVVADLLSQAEHGPDSQVVLVSDGSISRESLENEIRNQLVDLPRSEIISQALDHALMIDFDDIEIAFDFINSYAPEHLIITTKTASECIPLIKNAGSVFIGEYTPESAGDYASGTNHTLPTSGYARSYSGVSLDSFVKKITFQTITKKGLEDLGPTIIEMAEAEKLSAHAMAVKKRLSW